MSRLHALSFDAFAPDYDRYRPGYPDALFEEIAARIGLPDRPRVADLGAGTGLASLAMARRGWSVIAVEPGASMLAVLRERAVRDGFEIETVEARAEDTGLADGSVDLAAAAQSFHWFDRPRAVAEMARILRPGGGVALFWNVRDETRSPFVADYHRLVDAQFGSAQSGHYLQSGPVAEHEATRAAFDGVDGLDGLSLSEVRHQLRMTADDFIGMAFTASYVRGLEEAEQGRYRARVHELLERHGMNAEPFVIPYRIDLWTARRSDQ